MIVATFDPSLKTSDTFNTNLPINGKFLLINQSNVNLQLTFADGETKYAPAWQITMFKQPTPSSLVNWTQQSILAGTANPISHVTIDSCQPNKEILGTYPVAVQHTAYIPNNVTTMVNSLSNENSPTGSEVIDIGVQSNQRLVDIFNDHFVWSVLQGGVKHQVLQGRTSGKALLLGDPNLGDHVEVAFTLDVNGNFFLVGNATLDDGAASTDGSGNMTVQSLSDPQGRTRQFHPLSPYQIHNNGTVNSGITLPIQATGVGGVPTGATHVLMNWYFTSSTVNAFMRVVPHGYSGNNSDYPIFGLISVANAIMCYPSAKVALDTNGKYDVIASGGNLVGIYASIYGYYI